MSQGAIPEQSEIISEIYRPSRRENPNVKNFPLGIAAFRENREGACFEQDCSIHHSAAAATLAPDRASTTVNAPAPPKNNS